jgi:hypothetical protein
VLDVAKSDVTLIGNGAVIGGGGSISGDRVTVRGFAFVSTPRVGGELQVSGEDVRIASNRFDHVAMGATGARFRADSNRLYKGSIVGDVDAEIVGNRVRGCGSLIVGERGRIERNRSPLRDQVNVFGNDPQIVVRQNRVQAIHVGYSDGAVFEDNVARQHIKVWGDDVSVARNRTIRGEILVTGDRAVVDGNRIGRAVYGLVVEGDLPTVTSNVVVARAPNRDPFHPSHVTFEAAMTVTGAVTGATIEGNRVQHFRGPGIVVTSENAQIADNTLHGQSAQASIAVVGSGNALTGNDVVHSGWSAQSDGITVDGSGNEIRDNRVTGTSHEAIAVLHGGSNVIANVVVESDAGTGIVVLGRAWDTSVTDCYVSGCRVGLSAGATVVTGTTLVENRVADLVNLGGVTLGEGNLIGVVVTPYAKP